MSSISSAASADFSLGLERAGMRTVAFCEIDPFCRRVLARHWPHIPCYDDVRTLTAARLAADGIVADVIAGGFPCQDISVAGKAAGLAGERSGLWSEYARIIGEIRPRYIIVENVAALLGRGLARVLGDLAALGYDAEWHCIPASAVGAPHRRDRIWIVAHASSSKLRDQSRRGNGTSRPDQAITRNNGQAQFMADAIGARLERCASLAGHIAEELQAIERGGEVSDANSEPPRRLAISWRECGHWESEPTMGELAYGVSNRLVRFRGRVASGIPNRVNKLRALGNAVIPQIPEIIGRAIMRHEQL